MLILEIFLSFTTGMTDIDLHRRSMQSAADREYRHLLEQKKILDDRDDLPFISVQNRFFRDATSGSPVFYGFQKITIDDAIQNLVNHTNRQHQWLLVEAYELFEKFVNRAYAFMGMDSPTRWPLRDFGGIHWDEVRSQSFQWYLEQARGKKDSPLSMLRQFRKVLPRMAQVESNNDMNCDLLVAVTLIGHMRHRIVHARGIVLNKEKFSTEILRKLGYSGGGMTKHQEFIDDVLLLSEGGTIQLLNVPDPNSSPPFQFHYDIFDHFVQYLLKYAHQAYLSLGGTPMSRFEVASATLALADDGA